MLKINMIEKTAPGEGPFFLQILIL